MATKENESVSRCGDNSDVFREIFKLLKRKKPPPDFSDVIDFSSFNENTNYAAYKIVKPETDIGLVEACGDCESHGLMPHSTWKLFGCRSSPGFIFIENPFTPAGQTRWIKKCLEEYPLHPHRTNLEAVFYDSPWRTVNGSALLKKLRWSTLGYHHNWDTKIYSRIDFSPFPECLKRLSQHTASVLDLCMNPQAAIINYYHVDSTLGGHTDHSELDLTLPLLSFSFGRTGIFMLGGRSKAIKPVAMFVRSGDVLVMSGESRHAYHAVPKILPWEPGDLGYSESSDDHQLIQEYLKMFRINMNVRQVAADW